MIKHAASMSGVAKAQIISTLFTAFHMQYNITGLTDMLSDSAHMVQIRISQNNSINLSYVTPRSVGQSWRAAC